MSAPVSAAEVALEATRAFVRGDYAAAVSGYERCVTLAPGDPAHHFNLGTAREQRGELAGAIAAYLAAWRLNPRDARIALFAGAALAAAGRHEDAAVMFSFGDEIDLAVRRAKDRPDVHTEIRRRSAVADRVMREHFTRLQAAALEEFERGLSAGGAAPDLARIRNAVWAQTHDRPFAYRTPQQRPTLFYVPDLPAMPVVPRDRLPWAAAVEAATAAVRDEYLAAIAGGAAHAPYVDASTRGPAWQTLRGKLDWSALHLYKVGAESPFISMFPRTLAALEAADLVRVEGRPVELLFSRLLPGAHIPPHFGSGNHRITVHLPLIVPGDCEIRVGNARHAWQEGELFAFDDSFEHEAWNRSREERVVLIFEAHHPDLRVEERAAIAHATARRANWLLERQVPS